MFLKGDKVCLRALEPADADLLYRWENEMSLWPASFTQIPFSRYVLDEFVNSVHQDIYSSKQLRLMVDQAGDSETIGIIDLFEFDPQHARCGVGIYINENHRKNGKADETIRLVREYAFNVLHLKQLFAHVASNNTASLALFEKNGFEKSGLKKCWHKTGVNSYEDVWFLQCMNG
jgi:diamine N-acetyltransferase